MGKEKRPHPEKGARPIKYNHFNFALSLSLSLSLFPKINSRKICFLIHFFFFFTIFILGIFEFWETAYFLCLCPPPLTLTLFNSSKRPA